MKYFTKEWYDILGKTDLHLNMRVTKKSEKFDEKYYEDLYKKELKQFLKEQKEICEMTEEEVFDESTWDEIHIMDEEGNLVNVKEFMSEEEIEKLRQSILEDERKAAQNFEMEEYDEKKLTEQFKENHLEAIEYLKKTLPGDILKDVADIRVLALDKVAKDIKRRIAKYCQENEKKSEEVMENYNKYFEDMEKEIPEKILENYNFHDCQIISIDKIDDDIVFNLDNSGGFTEINKIIYKDAKILENNFEENAYWIYDEIYKLEKYYEFHVGIAIDGGYEYITLSAADVDFE